MGNTSGWLLLVPAHNEFLPTSPLKPIPWKSPTTFPSQGKNITPMHVTEKGGNCCLSNVFKHVMKLGGAEKQKLTENVLRRIYIICVATYLYLRIVTFHVNRKIRRENNTYRRLSEGPASIPPNCHVHMNKKHARRIQRWLSKDPARICLPSVKLLFHDQF